MEEMSYTEQQLVGMYPCLIFWQSISVCSQINGVKCEDACDMAKETIWLHIQTALRRSMFSICHTKFAALPLFGPLEPNSNQIGSPRLANLVAGIGHLVGWLLPKV